MYLSRQLSYHMQNRAIMALNCIWLNFKQYSLKFIIYSLVRFAFISDVARSLTQWVPGTHWWSAGCVPDRMDESLSTSSHKKLLVTNMIISIEKRSESYPKVNPLWPSDAIWRQGSGSTLAQVMACCLMVPSHYLNQCWLIISKVQWHSSEGSLTKDTSAISIQN